MKKVKCHFHPAAAIDAVELNTIECHFDHIFSTLKLFFYFNHNFQTSQEYLPNTFSNHRLLKLLGKKGMEAFQMSQIKSLEYILK